MIVEKFQGTNIPCSTIAPIDLFLSIKKMSTSVPNSTFSKSYSCFAIYISNTESNLYVNDNSCTVMLYGIV